MAKCKHCEKTAIGRGLCRNHYQQDWRKRVIAGYEPGIRPPLERLLEKRHISKTGCWEWTGAHRPDGYGLMDVDGVQWRTHRLMYKLTFGEISEEIFVCHKCDNPKCFNPKHLFLGTSAENLADAASKNRFPLGLKHWNAKLSNKQVSEILKSTESQAVLGRRYGVSQTYISRVKSGIRRSKSNS